MPLQQCTVDGKQGWKWGRAGKCYAGSNAKAKARKQGAAIRASGYVGNQARNLLRLDPTRTTTLQRQFATEITKRMEELKRRIRKLIVERDAFGLAPSPFSINTTNTIFAGLRDPAKVAEFEAWLSAQIGSSLTDAAAQDVYAEFARRGYQRGVGRAFDDVRRTARNVESLDFYQGTKEQFLRQSFAHPVSVDRLKLLAGRTFADVKNVTEAMRTQMRRTLVDGLARGAGPREIARQLSKDVDRIGKTRARIIARTEIVRAHADGQLSGMEQLGVDKVGVMAEWSTAGDDRVCPLCLALEGAILKISEARMLIPRHAQCRCAWIPANIGESTADQIRGKSSLRKAIQSSVKRERGKTKWPGARRRIAKKRPEPVVD